MEKTLPLMIKTRAEKTPDINIQLYKDNEKKFSSVTYSQFYGNVCSLAAGLLELGVKRNDNVAIIADNRKEWMLADFAILSIGAADVPRGGDSTPQELSYILGITSCETAFAENQKLVSKILSCKTELPALKTIITFDLLNNDEKAAAESAGLKLLHFPEIIELGNKRKAKNPGEIEAEIEKGDEEDTATIIFTSGTTGEPKGVVLSHRNFLCQAQHFNLFLELKPGDIFLSMLPVWHVYERLVEYSIFYFSATIAYSKPIASILMEDFLSVRPHWMISVPRIWEAIMDGINRNVKNMGSFTKKMFDLAVTVSMIYTYLKDKTFWLLPDFYGRVRILDSLIGFPLWLLLLPARGIAQLAVFNRIKKGLGGRLKAGISGGGALPARVDLFFNSIGMRFQEAYGLTEAAPLVSVRRYKRSRRGTIGRVLPDTEVKIADKNGNPLPPGCNGIIFVKGRQVMKGYYKKPEATASVLSEDGWLNTGDIGMLSYDNELRITGRAKDTIVLRGGENIEPVPIECKLRESPYIEQCMVCGQDQKCLAAIIIPRQQAIMDFAEEISIPIVDYELLLQQPEINELIASEISERVSAKTGFKSFERIYRFVLLPEPFEQGKELSGKGELLRHIITDKYAKEIHRLFK